MYNNCWLKKLDNRLFDFGAFPWYDIVTEGTNGNENKGERL